MRSVRAFIVLIAGGLCCLSATAEAPEPPRADAGTRLVLLGTGTPNADPRRMGPAVAVVVGEQAYLVDMGPGIVRRAAEGAEQGIPQLRPDNLDKVFVTHLHSDHTAGFADLLLTTWVLERERPLQVYGPTGIDEMAGHLRAAYRQDIELRLKGFEPINTEGHKVDTHILAAGVVYRDEQVTVEAIPVRHGNWKEAWGFKFTTPDKSIVISGDAAPSESLVKACNGCDILVHEVYSDSGFARREPVWQKYHSSFHTSASELAELATRAKPKLLVLYHQLFWGTSDADLVREVEKNYSGKVVSGRDLQVIPE